MEYFENVLNYLPLNLSSVLENIEPFNKEIITEIRIRKSMPLMVSIRNNCYFVCERGKLLNYLSENSFIVSERLFSDTFSKLCNYSVHSHTSTLVQGFITVGNGNRVGVASNAVIKSGEIVSVKDVFSLNIRIARSFNTVSKPVLNSLFVNGIKSVIIAGEPGSGKTTVLREMAKDLSSGFCRKYRKVSIVDERGELSCEGQISVGVNTDVISYFPKAIGIEMAVRTLSPDIIICDEISTETEVVAVSQGFSSGVKFILSVHISKREDIFNKIPLKKLLLTNEFSYIVLLKEDSNEFEIIDCEDIVNEIVGSNIDCN